MIKNTMLGLTITIGILYSLTSTAEDKYPAANFEPKVIFLEKTVKAQSPAPSPDQASDKNDPKYPAANFQPQVVYIDKNIQERSTDSSDVLDPKYPAANFKPRVIYP